MHITGSDVHIDFSKSSPPCRGPLNSVRSTTMAGVFIGFKHVFPDVPVNEGCFRPFSFNLPETTFLNAQHPRPVAGCAAEVCQRVIDVVLGALGKAFPERAYAGPMGTVTNLSVGGDDPERGLYVLYSFIGGGYGGNYLTDGLTNGNPRSPLRGRRHWRSSSRVTPSCSSAIRSGRIHVVMVSAAAGLVSCSSLPFDAAPPLLPCWEIAVASVRLGSSAAAKAPSRDTRLPCRVKLTDLSTSARMKESIWRRATSSGSRRRRWRLRVAV